MIEVELFINDQSYGVSQLDSDGFVEFTPEIEESLYVYSCVLLIYLEKPFWLHRSISGDVIYPGQSLKFQIRWLIHTNPMHSFLSLTNLRGRLILHSILC